MGIEDGEQTYDGSAEGVRAAAAELSDSRERRDAAVAREAADRPPPRQQTEADIANRDMFRNTVVAQVAADAEAEGGKLSSRKAAQALALLREHEADSAQLEAEQAQQAEQYGEAHAEQVAAQAAESQSVDNHPHVQATLQKLAQHEVAMEGERQHYATLSSEVYRAAFAGAIAEFGDIQTEADVQYLAQTDPARYGRFAQTYQNLVAAKNHIAQVGQHQAAQHQAQFHAYAQQHDGEFKRRHPELQNPAASVTAATNVVEAFKAVGISENEIMYAWKNNPLLRDHRVQELMHELGRWYAARENVRGGGRHPVPAVQRPSARRESVSHDYSEVAALNRKFGDGPLTVKEAAMLKAAQRRAAR